MKYPAFTLALCVALCATSANSQTFKTLLSFTGTSGAASGKYPYGSLALGGSTLYGMTYAGGAIGWGNIFSVGVNGANYRNLVSFTYSSGTADGSEPFGSLTLSGTTLYGMTSSGGTNDAGNIFSVGIDGLNYTDLFSFSAGTGSAETGMNPQGSLTLSGTTLYGMTVGTGVGLTPISTAFSVGTGGTNFQTLVSFDNKVQPTFGPYGSLTLGGTNLYGMTYGGGLPGGGVSYGNVFSVGTSGGNYQNLLSFDPYYSGVLTAKRPYGSLTLSGTTLYGMTSMGGTNVLANGKYAGNVFSVGVDGTNYKSLLSFTGTGGVASGQYPHGSLVISDTTLYGMTLDGGINGYGNIFGVGIDGSDYKNLYSFTGGGDGRYPWGDLTLSGGTLFGMTSASTSPYIIDSTAGYGTVFALALPTPTPEPGTLALIGTGAIALVSYRWRKMRSR